MERAIAKTSADAAADGPSKKKPKLTLVEKELVANAKLVAKQEASKAKEEAKEAKLKQKEKDKRMRDLKKTAGDEIKTHIGHYKQTKLSFCYPASLFSNWQEVCDTFQKPSAYNSESFSVSYSDVVSALGSTKAGRSFRYSNVNVDVATISKKKGGKVSFEGTLSGSGGYGGFRMYSSWGYGGW
jgi:hypothetical protein